MVASRQITFFRILAHCNCLGATCLSIWFFFFQKTLFLEFEPFQNQTKLHFFSDFRELYLISLELHT